MTEPTRTFRAPLHRVGLPLVLVLLLVADSLEDYAPDWPTLSLLVLVVAVWLWARVRLTPDGMVVYGWHVRRYAWAEVQAVEVTEVRWLEQGVRVWLTGRETPLEPGVLAGIAYRAGAADRMDVVGQWWRVHRGEHWQPAARTGWDRGWEPTA